MQAQLKPPKFSVGDEVSVIYTNPGYSGKIVLATSFGCMVDIFATYTQQPSKTLAYVLESWCEALKADEDRILCSPVYWIDFGREIVPGRVLQGTDQKTVKKTRCLWASELDIQSSADFWAELNRALEQGEKND